MPKLNTTYKVKHWLYEKMQKLDTKTQSDDPKENKKEAWAQLKLIEELLNLLEN